MNMKRVFLILLAVLAIAGSAHAQISWTLAQCRHAWGKDYDEQQLDEPRISTHSFHVKVAGYRCDILVEIGSNYTPFKTVSYVQYTKLDGKPFPPSVVDLILKKSVPSAKTVEWKEKPKNEDEPDKLIWIGTTDDDVPFLANESPNDKGNYVLSIGPDWAVIHGGESPRTED
jgi:hypothetical protein